MSIHERLHTMARIVAELVAKQQENERRMPRFAREFEHARDSLRRLEGRSRP